jgi:transposase
VLDVLESRDKDAVKAYLEAGKHHGLFGQLQEVTTDRWEGYVNAAREVFGEALRVTVDRFHVMKNFQDQLSAARREIQRALPKEAAQALKGSRWLWLTNAENLTPEQRAALAALKERFPPLKALAEQREALRALFEDPAIRDAETGGSRLRDWLVKARQLGLKALEKFCGTLERWLGEIANYFVARASNGRTEGFNHGLRSILWRAFGMRNFEQFRLRVLDRFGHPQSK